MEVSLTCSEAMPLNDEESMRPWWIIITHHATLLASSSPAGGKPCWGCADWGYQFGDTRLDQKWERMLKTIQNAPFLNSTTSPESAQTFAARPSTKLQKHIILPTVSVDESSFEYDDAWKWHVVEFSEGNSAYIRHRAQWISYILTVLLSFAIAL
ncbi:hypothetical protein Ddc_12491 [Ditylenchus destructor]|nr:hypothetical protein Ddc_12491 [Ditylenchus destructor]